MMITSGFVRRTSDTIGSLASGVTTMVGGGTGPATGTSATTCTPGPWHLARMLQAAEGLPVNLSFSGKGNASQPAALEEMIRAGACALRTPAMAIGASNSATSFFMRRIIICCLGLFTPV